MTLSVTEWDGVRPAERPSETSNNRRVSGAGTRTSLGNQDGLGIAVADVEADHPEEVLAFEDRRLGDRRRQSVFASRVMKSSGHARTPWTWAKHGCDRDGTLRRVPYLSGRDKYLLTKTVEWVRWDRSTALPLQNSAKIAVPIEEPLSVQDLLELEVTSYTPSVVTVLVVVVRLAFTPDEQKQA